MKNLHSFITEDNDVFGPGTDLVVSLAAVLIILIAANTNSFSQKLEEQNQIIVSSQELKIKNKECEEDKREFENTLQKIEDDKQELENTLQKIEANKQELENTLQKCEADKQELDDIIKDNEIGQVDIKDVEKNQMEIVNRIAANYNRKPYKIDENRYGISINIYKKNDIFIQNDVTIQRISFGSHILFDVDNVHLKENGKQVMTTVGNIFKQKLGVIKEIQIQGHADPRASRKFSSNLELAAHRAIEVFKHLQDLGIDPTKHIMSATSFGEYKPVQRQYSDMKYNSYQLRQDNNTSTKRERNRRIEIVLIYRRTLKD